MDNKNVQSTPNQSDDIVLDFLGKNILKGRDANMYSALTLAYLGDCIYEIFVRSYLTADGNHKVRDLHKTATKYVCAHAQAEFYHKISDMLTEEEAAVFRRGRNTKSHPPKNADMSEYKIATGIEALFGYLYVVGQGERLNELAAYIF